jgi:hypothetical protein
MGDVGETNLNSMVDSSGIPMSWATKGEGFVLNMKSWTTGIASFYKISPGLSAGAPPVVDIPSSFTNIAQNPEIAFGGVGSPLGGATGMYAVAMIDNDDRFSGEIWYCLGDNFDAWFGPIAFSLVGCNEYLPSNQQLYYLRDDKWVFVYTSRDDTIQFPFPSANIVELDLGGLS